MLYVWRTLVSPVASYGFEVYSWSNVQTKGFLRQQQHSWRSLLQVGGRSPGMATQTLMDCQCATIEWRVRRAALFMRLLASPAGSWTQLALLTLRELETPWFDHAVQDLKLVVPRLEFHNGYSEQGLCLVSSGWRSEDWVCDRSRIKRHVREISRELRRELRKREQTYIYWTSYQVAVR